MSLKRVLETLAGFGFKQPDAKIYVFLAKKGPHTAEEIGASLEMPRWQVYKSLRNMLKKGTVTGFIHRAALFSAIPFEEVIDLAAKAKTNEAQREHASAEQAILYWENMMKEDSDSSHELKSEEEEVKK